MVKSWEFLKLLYILNKQTHKEVNKEKLSIGSLYFGFNKSSSEDKRMEQSFRKLKFRPGYDLWPDIPRGCSIWEIQMKASS